MTDTPTLTITLHHADGSTTVETIRAHFHAQPAPGCRPLPAAQHDDKERLRG